MLRGRCLPYGEGITYWPLAEVVKDVARAGGRPRRGERRRSQRELAGEAKAELIAERVAEALGLGGPVGGTSEETFWAVRKLFEALARSGPLVVVFDDVHWAQPTFLDLVEHVADFSRDVPILLVCIARPELLDTRPGWGGGKLNATSILLEPLTEAESRRADLEPARPGAGPARCRGPDRRGSGGQCPLRRGAGGDARRRRAANAGGRRVGCVVRPLRPSGSLDDQCAARRSPRWLAGRRVGRSSPQPRSRGRCSIVARSASSPPSCSSRLSIAS